MEGFGGQGPFRRAFGGHFSAFGGRPPIGGQFGDYATTKRACSLEVRYGLHDEPKSRVSGTGLSKISEKKRFFFF